MIATAPTAEAREAAMFTTPEAVRQQPIHNAEALAFVATWEALNWAAPNPAPFDRLALRLLSHEITTEAGTIFLRELAEW